LKVAPESVLFQIPPVAAAAYTTPWWVGSGESSRIRPPMLLGPVSFHLSAAVESVASKSWSICADCAMAAATAS
jgi:hypothetical protein